MGDQDKDQQLRMLMIESQRGDKEAYSKLLDEAYLVLEPFISSRVNPSIADDVVQEILISLHKVRHTYDPSRPFLAWLYTIAKHRLTDILRGEYRHTRRIAAFKEERDAQSAIHESNALFDALSTLSERQRDVVTLHKLEGYSLSEIAQRFSLSVSAVKMTAHRAYEKLRVALTEDRDE